MDLTTYSVHKAARNIVYTDRRAALSATKLGHVSRLDKRVEMS